MTPQEVSQFEVKQSPPGTCLFFGVVVPLLFLVGGPIFFAASLYWGGIGFFSSFFLFVILINWLIDSKLRAKSLVVVDSLGIRIEVIRKGMGIPIGTSFSTWEQLRGFQYSTIGRGPNQLTLLWENGHKISFQQHDAEALYQYLVQTFPEKEKAFWWPRKS